jgi:hypothetical protein
LLGFPVFGALIATVALAVMERGNGALFRLTALAAGCVALSLAVFFTFTYPVNQQTQNWTMMPDNWEELRRHWNTRTRSPPCCTSWP